MEGIDSDYGHWECKFGKAASAHRPAVLPFALLERWE